MGRINLAALRVRQKALALVETGRHKENPVWTKVLAEVPPAQILIRQQPIKHSLTKTRTTSTGERTTQSVATKKRSDMRRSKHLYQPNEISYEEDRLRDQFFRDHPWELARPRLLVETDGNQHANADWSTGLEQPGIPVSGESVAQRQLWLLENKPDIEVPEAYDIARKEFYAIRRRQQIAQRIAVEEAENMGANFGPPSMSIGMTKESETFDKWMKWAEKENMAILARQASFAGQQPVAETAALQANNDATSSGSPGGGAGVGVGIGSPQNSFRRDMRYPVPERVGRESANVGTALKTSAQDIIAQQRSRQPVREVS